MILMNESGDVTITWTQEHEAEMRGLIEKKIKEGYSFFLVEKKFKFFNQKTKITSVDQIQRGSKILLRDEDAIRLFSEGKIQVEKNDAVELTAGKRLDDADEVLKSDTVAVRPIGAG